jgi:hypothetical protein
MKPPLRLQISNEGHGYPAAYPAAYVLVFENPEAWLSDPATDEKKVRRYLSFFRRWFKVQQKWVPETGMQTEAGLLRTVLNAFQIGGANSHIDGNHVFFLNEQEGKKAQRELLVVRELLLTPAERLAETREAIEKLTETKRKLEEELWVLQRKRQRLERT